jgi:glyoxylate reductase
MTRPLVLIDARIPDAPLAPLGRLASVLRYSNRDEMSEFISLHTKEIVGIAPLLTTPVDAALLDRLPNLRIVAVYAVGVDNVDLEAARHRAVVVTHTPDVLTEATADLTWALILSVARRIREGERLARSGEWAGWHPRQLLGKELHGGTLGILGLGRIGTAVARRSTGFGMDVVYTSRSARPEVEARLGARRLPFEKLLERADVVSIHLPLTADTRHMIDAAALARMKPDAILVNTARGPIVDEAALVEALDAGRLFGAGLDVFEEEPQIHPGLVDSDRVVLLPHVGSATVETRDAMARIVAENLAAALEGRAPSTAV